MWGDKVFLLTAVAVGDPAPLATPEVSRRQPPPDRGGRRDGRGGRRGGRGAQEVRAQQFTVMAFDRDTGAVVWERVAREALPHEGYQQPNGSYASGSAVTDGERLYAFFGSWGLYAYNLDGELQWEVDLGDRLMRNGFGEGTTPSAVRRYAGRDLGSHRRPVLSSRRSTPAPVKSGGGRTGTRSTPGPRRSSSSTRGRAQVITPAMNQVYSYDLETGETIWRSRGTTMNVIPSPVHADGMVYVTSGYRGNNLQAIRLADARGGHCRARMPSSGSSTETRRTCRRRCSTTTRFMCSRATTASCRRSIRRPASRTTRLQRLQGIPNVFASPVGPAGRVYITGRDGATLVIRQGPGYEVLAVNQLDDGFDRLARARRRRTVPARSPLPVQD